MLNLSLACMVAAECDPDPGWENREPLNQICGRGEWRSRAVVLKEEGAGRRRSSRKVARAHDVGGEGRRRRVLVETRWRSIPPTKSQNPNQIGELFSSSCEARAQANESTFHSYIIIYIYRP